MKLFIFSVIIIYYSSVKKSQMFHHHLCQFSVWASFLSSQHDATRINCCWARTLAADIDRQLRVAGARSCQSICPQDAQQQTSRTLLLLLLSINETDSDLESLSLVAKLCKCNSTIICAAIRVVSTDTAHPCSLGDSWTSCAVSEALYVQQNEKDF